MKRTYWMKQLRQENVIYLAVWGLLFAAPLLSLYVRTASDPNLSFNWNEVLTVWRHFAVYLVLFLVHNFLLAPLLVHGHKRIAYFSAVTVMLAAFTVYQCSNKPIRRGHNPGDHRPPMERMEHQRPPMEEPPMAMDEPQPPHRMHRAGTPPPFVGEREILAVVMLMLMFAANLGIKIYFRSRQDRKRLAQLERENLEQQLEYLRYQINPHFFMNTLNNIHALVDIDPEKAKETILQLSKLMRYLLYEGNKAQVHLYYELDFIRHYISLMRLRYTDKVKITLDLPTEVSDRQIPPLLLITFVENAFKHGVSYQQESFINVQVTLEEHQLLFTCSNYKTEKPNPEKGGVGLQNARQRLNLLYDNNYTLQIQDSPDVYTVHLTIPI